MTDKKKAEEAKKVGREFKRWRAVILSEVWCALRDAPGGPMIDAMNIVNKMMEEMERGNNRPGSG